MIHEQQGDAVVDVCMIEMITREQVKLEGLSEIYLAQAWSKQVSFAQVAQGCVKVLWTFTRMESP